MGKIWDRRLALGAMIIFTSALTSEGTYLLFKNIVKISIKYHATFYKVAIFYNTLFN